MRASVLSPLHTCFRRRLGLLRLPQACIFIESGLVSRVRFALQFSKEILPLKRRGCILHWNPPRRRLFPGQMQHFADDESLRCSAFWTRQVRQTKRAFLKIIPSLVCNSAGSRQLQRSWAQRSPHHLQATEREGERERETIKVDNNLLKATAAPTGFISPSFPVLIRERDVTDVHAI